MTQRTGGDHRPLLAGLASALVAVLFFGWFVTFGPGRSVGPEVSAMEAAASQSPKRSAQTPTTVASVLAPRVTSPAPGAVSGDPQVLPRSDAEALTVLNNKIAASAQAVAIDGQWAAQLASKYVGIVDPAQVTATGSHKFYAGDILAEHVALASQLADTRLVLLDSRTFGAGKRNGDAPYYVTVALDPTFTGADRVMAWCASRFEGLTGTALTDRCLPTQLTPVTG
mgnify:FL=1